MAEIPEDIILDILSLLPLKILVQFKCLNKKFNQSISTPTFQNHRADFNSFAGYECIFHKFISPQILKFMTIKLPCRRSRGEISNFSVRYNNAHASKPIILTSSCGLLLISLRQNAVEDGRSSYRRRPRICLFNPATGAYKFLPRCWYDFSGVGLVLENLPSYKLVFLFCYKNSNYQVFRIYESDSKRWHRSESLRRPTNLSIQMEHQEAYYLNDSLYWLAIKDKTKGKILAFNVKTEVSEIINLPEALVGGCLISAIRDELALITGERNNEIFIWIYNFIHRKWKIHRIFESYVIPGQSLIEPLILPLFYDENQNRLILYKMCSNGAFIEEIMANSTENIVCISVFSTWSNYWRIIKHHFSGSLKEISDCQYLVNGLKGMKETIPKERFNRQNLYFEDLLFITECCSFLE